MNELKAIQPNELRIGNLLNHSSKRHKERYIVVESIGMDRVNLDFRDYTIEGLSGIPLTEDILVKLGFVKCNGKYGDYFKHEEWDLVRIWINTVNYVDYFILGRKEVGINIYNCVRIKDIYFVHQLQNLFFELTGAELNTDKIFER